MGINGIASISSNVAVIKPMMTMIPYAMSPAPMT